MNRTPRCVALGLSLSLALLACSSGSVGGPAGPNAGASSGAPGAGSGPSGGAAAGPGAGFEPPTPEQLEAQPPSPSLRRLTLSQYRESVRDLLAVTPDTGKLTPLAPINGLRALAASALTLPEKDVEAFATLADSLSAQVFADVAGRQKLTGCDGKQSACAQGFVASFGRRAFRRPLTADERARYLALLNKATQATGDGWLGLQVVVNALLQSPNMLYRSELGEPDPAAPGQRRLSDLELASRLSFFLWNSAPDAELLDAAESGALATKEGLSAQAKRLLAAPRAAEASEELFSDYLQLDALDALAKLPETYPQATPALAAAMKEETLTGLRELLFLRGADFRTAFTSTKTFVNADLAKLYGLRAPNAAGFSEVELPAKGPRAGLVLQAGFLALHSHPSRSSPTLRGKFIRESLLCLSIPPPPPDVETALPNTGAATTARQKLSIHREQAKCAGCHGLMDPMGLALENFDGIGAYRETESGLPIDASGELDDATFQDARGFVAVLAEHEALPLCFAKTALRYARGALEHSSEEPSIAALNTRFEAGGFRVADLLLAIATDRSFRYVGALP
jgi:hypothetical protein